MIMTTFTLSSKRNLLFAVRPAAASSPSPWLGSPSGDSRLQLQHVQQVLQDKECAQPPPLQIQTFLDQPPTKNITE